MPKITDPALLAQLSGGVGPQPVQIAPADPKLPGQVAGQGLTNQRTQQDIVENRQMLPLQVRKAAADAAKAEAEARKESGLDPQKLANIRAAQSQIDRLNSLFVRGPGSTKGISSLLDFIPSSTNAQFDTAGAGLGEVGLAAFRVPGVGSQSDAELRAFVDANRPRASDFDARIKEKLRNLQSRLDQTYSAYGMKRQTSKRQSKVIDFSDLPE